MRPVAILLTVACAGVLSANAAASRFDVFVQAPQADTSAAADDKKKPALPLEATDRVTFETDEGTWISLDVTPDGHTIVFELAGDLYTLPMEGGRATRITSGLAFDSQPRVSPDGTRVAFISDRSGSDNVWLAKIDGSDAKKMSNESDNAVISPDWTPDGRLMIASVRVPGRGTQPRMYHVDGGTGITLGEGESSGGRGGGGGGAGPSRLGAVVDPDGRYLYAAQVSGGGSGAQLPNWQIARLDMRTGDVDVITQGGGRAFRPALSPDGRWLVYATRHEAQTGLRIRDLQTGADRSLAW